MSTLAQFKQDHGELIPPNPSALDFESKFRDNLTKFLDGMITVENDVQAVKVELGVGDSAGLTDGVASLTANATHAFAAIEDLLTTGVPGRTNTLSWQDANGVDITNPTYFSSLVDRFSYTDQRITNGYDLVNGVSTGTFSSLADRFDDVEGKTTVNTNLLADIKTNEISYAKKLYNNNTTTFTSIPLRFKEVEERTYDLEVEVNAAHRNATDTLDARFDAIESEINDATNSHPDNHADLNTRFNSIDSLLQNAHTQVNGSTTADFSSIQARFDDTERILKESYDEINGISSPGTYTSIQDRFDDAEGKIDTAANDITTLQNSLANKANLSGSLGTDFQANNLSLDGELTFTGTFQPFELKEVLDSSSNITDRYLSVSSTNWAVAPLDQVVNKNYVIQEDNKIWTDVNTLKAKQALPDWDGIHSTDAGTTDEGKILQVSGGNLTWQTPANVNTSTPYNWIPDVAFQQIQFDGVCNANRNLDAGFFYYVAGDLRVAAGVTLTIEGGSGATQGARLIIQGHLLLEAGAAVVVQQDSLKPNLGSLHVDNWHNTSAPYRISNLDGEFKNGVVTTSFLGLQGKTYIIPGPLEMDENTQLINDVQGCHLLFKADAIDQSVTTPGVYQNDGLITEGSIGFFDTADGLNKLSEFFTDFNQVNSAYDTLKEISDELTADNDAYNSLLTSVNANTQNISNLSTFTGYTSTPGGGSSLQSQINDLSSYVGMDPNATTSLNADIQLLQSEMDTAEGRLDNVEADITQNADDITQNAAAIADLDNKVVTKYYEGSFIETKLQALKTDIEGNSSLVDALSDLETSFANFDNPLDAVLSELSQKADFTYSYSEVDDGAGNTTITYDLTTPNPDFTSVESMHDHTISFDSRLTSVENNLNSTYATHLNVSTEIGNLRDEILNNSTLVSSLSQLEDDLATSGSELTSVLNLLTHKAEQSYQVTETTNEILYDLTNIPDDYTGIQPMYDYAQTVNANVISHEARVGKFESRFAFSEQLDSSGDVEAYVYSLSPKASPTPVPAPVPLELIFDPNPTAGSTILWDGAQWVACDLIIETF